MWNYWTGYSPKNNLSIAAQAKELLIQLKNHSPGNRIIKITFFTGCLSLEYYENLFAELQKLTVQTLGYSTVISLVPQAPVEHDICIEAWIKPWDSLEINMEYGTIDESQYLRLKDSQFGDLLIISTRSFAGHTDEDAQSCFHNMARIHQTFDVSFGHIVRQWNYIGDILKLDDGRQNYQLFNEARAHHFNTSDFPWGYPAATGIGMDIPGVIIDACYLKPANVNISAICNPLQTSAHRYSEKVLVSDLPKKAKPRFERAKAIANHEKGFVFISGTAAIKGENTIETHSVEEQTRHTIEIIKNLSAPENLKAHIGKDYSLIGYKGARVYLKKEELPKAVSQMVNINFDEPSALFLVADICRNNLLVEIEVMLEIVNAE